MVSPVSRRRWLEGSLALALSPGLARRAAAAASDLPAPLDGSWRDAARNRDLPWRLRLPATPGPWPLVVYSHGLGGGRGGAELWGRAWAAGGIAVLHLQHPGSDSETLRAGLRKLAAAANAEQLRERALDVRFAIDAAIHRMRAGDEFWGAMREDAIGVGGHSFGAHTTQAVAGQRYAVAVDLSDPRPRAFIALSPSSPAGGRMSLEDSFGAITRPFMVATGSLDGDPFGSFDTGAPRAAVYDGLPPGQRALLWLDGADHMTFGGGRPRGLGAWVLMPRKPEAAAHEAAHQRIVAQLTTQWWRTRLLGDEGARLALAQPEGLGPRDRFTLG